MIIIPIKESESIDKALKRFKKKFERIKVLKELRERKQFTKPSVKKRQEKIQAAYKNKLLIKEIL